MLVCDQLSSHLDLIESFRKYSNGKDIEEREKYIAQEIAFYLWLDEINAPYEIEYIDSKSSFNNIRWMGLWF